MDDEPSLIRCPSCGSVLTGPLEKTGMWECRYHLCRAVFPIEMMQENGRAALVCEERGEYLCRRRDSPRPRNAKGIRW